MKAYLLKESLERLWTYHYEGAILRYLQLDGPTAMPTAGNLLEPCQDVARSFRWNSELLPRQSTLRCGGGHRQQRQILLRRGRGYKNLRYLLLKAQRMAATKTEFIVSKKAA
jgi:hypothetical protein